MFVTESEALQDQALIVACLELMTSLLRADRKRSKIVAGAIFRFIFLAMFFIVGIFFWMGS